LLRSYAPDPEIIPMSFSRRWMLNVFFAIILCLTAAAILFRFEIWPICNYPMFDKLDVHPESDSLEFYTLAPGEQEEWIHEDASIGQLHHDFALKAILQQDGWPSAKASESFHRVIQEMRTEREPMDSAWAGPVRLRAYVVHYRRPKTGSVRNEVTGKTLVLEVVDAPTGAPR